MSIRRGRNAGPVEDNRLVQRPEDDTVYKSPFSRNLGHTTGLAHHSGDLLKQDLTTTEDYSRRESSRPIGDIYSDMQNMITHTVNSLPAPAASLNAGDGLVKVGDTISVANILTNVTQIGALSELTVNGPAVFNDTVSVPAPTAPSDAATKLYVDSTGVSAGAGLTKSGNALSVNAEQGGVVSVGTLTGLTVDGPATFNDTVSVPLPTDASDCANKTYVDSKLPVAGAGLVQSGNTFSLDNANITSIGTLTSLIVDGPATFLATANVPAPVSGDNVANKTYVDGTVVTAGTGLSKSGNELSIDADQSAVITAVGTLSSLTVDGDATFNGAVLVRAPAAGGEVANKTYVDGTVVTAGAGLTKVANALSLDADQSGTITTIGALTGLTVDGTSVFNGVATFNNDTAFTGDVTVPTPAAGSSVANKDYVDTFVDNSAVVAGAGLVRTGNTLSVDGATITTIGTLTGLNVAGNATVDGLFTTTKAWSSSMQYAVPADGDIVSLTEGSPGIFLDPAGALGVLTLDFPATPTNGQRFSVHSSQDVGSVTALASFANGNGPTSITAGVPLKFIYSTDAGLWFRD